MSKQTYTEMPLLGPLHTQVRDVLRGRILNLEWTPGNALPSESDLAREMAVSIGTMRKAIKALEAESLVVRFRGRGTFVSEVNDDSTLQRFSNITDGRRKLDLSSQLVNCKLEQATDEDAKWLEAKAGENVFKITRNCIIPDKYYGVERIVAHEAVFPELDKAPNLTTSTLFGIYRNRFNVIVSSVDEAVSCLNATAELARDLRVDEGAAVMCIDRTARSFTGQVIEWSRRFISLKDANYKISMS